MRVGPDSKMAMVAGGVLGEEEEVVVAGVVVVGLVRQKVNDPEKIVARNRTGSNGVLHGDWCVLLVCMYRNLFVHFNMQEMIDIERPRWQYSNCSLCVSWNREV